MRIHPPFLKILELMLRNIVAYEDRENLAGDFLEVYDRICRRMALMGYAIGNYGAFLAAWLCYLLSG